MENQKKPNALAELMARDIVGEQLSALRQKPQPQPHIPNSADKGLSPSTLKALARFGPGNASSIKPTSKPEPLPLPGTDWELWALMPKAPLTEVVAVFLGIDPSALKPRSGYAEPGKKFDDLLKLACAFVNEAGPLRPIKELGHLIIWGKPEEAIVSLPEFAQWALSMGYELPERFPRLKAAPRQPATNSTAPAITATQNPVYVAIQQIVKSELQKHKPAPVVPIEPQAPPVVAESASAGVEPDKAGPVWSLKASIQRAPGYRWPLYQVLKAAFIAGQPCPKARDVLNIWGLNPPPDVQVMPDGVKYNDGLGNPKEADLKAIGQAIKNLMK